VTSANCAAVFSARSVRSFQKLTFHTDIDGPFKGRA
jgi:hypothetical protein